MNHMTCLNVKVKYEDQTSTDYIFIQNFLTHGHRGFFINLKPFKKSWNEASKLCRKLGGFLPHFKNRDELEAFTSIPLKSLKIPSLEAIFIGLMSNGSQVNKIS